MINLITKINKIISGFLVKGSFTKSIMLIVGGTGFAQALTILIGPILSRMYSPADFGVLTVYTSILGLFAGSQSLRYELAIPIAEDKETAFEIMILCIMIIISGTILISTGLIFYSEPILNFLSAETLLEYSYIIPIGFALYGLYQILMMWNYREKNFNAISKTKVSQSISGNIFKLAMGIINPTALGLIIGRVISESAGILTLSQSLPGKKTLKINSNSNTRKSILEKIIRYKEFPMYTLPSTFISKLSAQLPTLFLAGIFNANVVGYYGFATGIVNIPVALIGNAVGDVFYAEAADIGKSNPKSLKILSDKLFKRLLLLGMIPLIVLLFFGPSLFELFFGQEWLEAGLYARILAVLSFAQLIFQPLSRIYDIFEKQKDLLILTILRVILVTFVFYISIILALEPKVTISLYVIVMVLMYALTFLRANMILALEEKNIKSKE